MSLIRTIAPSRLVLREQNLFVDGLVSQPTLERSTDDAKDNHVLDRRNQPNFEAEGTPLDLLPWILGFPPSEHVPPRGVALITTQ
jgi:hypothetical protein